MALTDAKVKTARLPDNIKQLKISDGRGLYLLINGSGKYWRYDYKFDGKRKTLSIGTYPAVPLAGKLGKDGVFKKGARDLIIDAKQLIKEGINPSLKKKSDRQELIAEASVIEAQQAIDANTFELIARQWHNTHKDRWSLKHSKTILRRFELHVFPSIGSVPVSQIHKSQVADVLVDVAGHGTVEIAKRIGQIIRQVLEYASDRGLIDAIPMGNTKNLIPTCRAKPMPAITDSVRLSELLRAIGVYRGSFVTCKALKLVALTATRSGEFRTAEWIEFDLEKALWIIPATHRKISKEDKEDHSNTHYVPLSEQAVILLKELQQLTGRGTHVFPSVRGDARPMSENTINVALAAMGFKGEMVGHGWRSVFSTILNEKGFNPDAIERQLAHTDKNKVRALGAQ